MKFMIIKDLKREDYENYKKQGLYCYNFAYVEKDNSIGEKLGSLITTEKIKLDDNGRFNYLEFISKNKQVYKIEELTLKVKELEIKKER